MGSNLNFKNFGTDVPPGNYPLARQSSVYALTFDEFQNAVGGPGKDFGSMNMDELLKSIWSAEENQSIGSSTSCANGGHEGSGYLQRQGSLTLPRTLSHKTVDEVWRDMSKDYGGEKVPTGSGGFGVPHQQPTLGEVTLEEFLVRAGVVKEEARPKNVDPFGNNLCSDFDASDRIVMQSANLPLNVNGARSVGYGAPLANPGIRGGIVGISDPVMNNDAMVQNVGLVGLGGNGVSVITGSPAVSSDGLTKSNGDTSSVSPVPYVFSSGGLRGRKSAALEKVVERRQRRMIKNRESAARSRARKQAYTMDLEAEVAKLKEENELLQKKQAAMLEMKKNQVLERMEQQNGNKRRCLRRTQTGPW